MQRSASARDRTAYAIYGSRPSVPTGFRARTTIDDSPEATRQTRLAVARAKEGDEAAIQFLYIRFANNVYGYVRSIVRDDYDAEDITQHVFAKLMTAIVKHDERGAPFFAWLIRFARNVAIDHMRAQRMIPVENVLDADTSSPVDIDRTMAVRDALATLPEDQREVVVLRHIVGLTPGEIADRLGRTEGSIHGLHHRGRRALQSELTRHEAQPAVGPRAVARAARTVAAQAPAEAVAIPA